MNTIIQQLKKEFNINEKNITDTVNLIEEGNTIPFIARYRKEITGNMSDETLRDFDERLTYLKNLEQRKEEVIRSIEKQGQLTDELEKRIRGCMILKEVEDLYLPFKPKKRTRATIAKEKGLEPFATIILNERITDEQILQVANDYIEPEKGVESVQDAVDGACDILAEQVSENADFRKRIRTLTYSRGIIITVESSKNEDDKKTFEMYYDYREAINKIVDHRILAINRGEKKNSLKVSVESPREEIISYLRTNIVKDRRSEILFSMIEDSYKRLIEPSIERELRATLTERAEKSAIDVFAKNLKSLLLAPPVKGKVIMGFDPAFRTGCKIAVINAVGKLLDYTTVYPTEPQNKTEEAKKTLLQLIKKHQVDIISIGNGTASRESELFVSEMIKHADRNVQYVIVNEAGASVYSASKLGTEEYPELNVSIRGAVSIAQRLKDPLAELVKIDPKHIGVGQYQHDVDQKMLSSALEKVVEDAVNSVGVDINTASPALLAYVSGITKKTSRAIYDYVKEHSGMKTRSELLKVSGIGAKAYEQCAGFLRIPNGNNLLDRTAVHPESYQTTEKLLKQLQIDSKDPSKETIALLHTKLDKMDAQKFANEAEIGLLTLKDIIEELKKPGRDPRESLMNIAFKSYIMEIEDLKEGMRLSGTVRNITHFGAFVDIGVHQDGLVHISQLSDSYVKDPFDVVQVGDIVNVMVLEADAERKRISLTMKGLS